MTETKTKTRAGTRINPIIDLPPHKTPRQQYIDAAPRDIQEMLTDSHIPFRTSQMLEKVPPEQWWSEPVYTRADAVKMEWSVVANLAGYLTHDGDLGRVIKELAEAYFIRHGATDSNASWLTDYIYDGLGAAEASLGK